MTRSKREMTERQREVLDYIVDVLREQGYPPTVREIADHFNMASAYGVQRHLAALQKKGYLRREAGARAITLSPGVLQALDNTDGNYPIPSTAPINARMVPLVGKVAAGVPITAEQNVDDMLPLPDQWLRGNRDMFLLKVKGDSMAPGIEDGDLVMVKPQQTAENGALVVALVGNEATVKRFFRERSRVILRPDNPVYEDIVVTSDLRLQGKVVGLIRHY